MDNYEVYYRVYLHEKYELFASKDLDSCDRYVLENPDANLSVRKIKYLIDKDNNALVIQTLILK